MFCFLNPHLQGKDSGPEGTLAAFFQGENLERHILASHSGDRTKPDRQIANTGFAEVPTVQSKPPCQISDNCSQKMKESRAALCSSVSPPPATEESGGGRGGRKHVRKSHSKATHSYLLSTYYVPCLTQGVKGEGPGPRALLQLLASCFSKQVQDSKTARTIQNCPLPWGSHL